MSLVGTERKVDGETVNVEDVLANFFLKKIDMKGLKANSENKYKKKIKHKKHKSKKHKHKTSRRSSSSEKNHYVDILDIVHTSSSEEKEIKRLKKIKKLDVKDSNKLNNYLPISSNAQNVQRTNEDNIQTKASVPIGIDIPYGPSLELLLTGTEINKTEPKIECEILLPEQTDKSFDLKLFTKPVPESIKPEILRSNCSELEPSTISENLTIVKVIESNKQAYENSSGKSVPNSKALSTPQDLPEIKSATTQSVIPKIELDRTNKKSCKKSYSRSRSRSKSKSCKRKDSRSRSRSKSKSWKQKDSRSRSRTRRHSVRSRSRHRSHSRSRRSRSSHKTHKRRSYSRDDSKSRKSSNPRSSRLKETSRRKRSHRSRSRSYSTRNHGRSHSRSYSRDRCKSDNMRRRSKSKSRRHRSRSRSEEYSSHGSKRKSSYSSKSCTKSETKSNLKRKSRSKSKEESSSKSCKIDQARILEIAQKNVLNMIEQGTLPEGLSLDHFKKKELVSLKSGGKSVQELTDFCAKLSKKENDDEGNSTSDANSQDKDMGFIHHPFKLKEQSMIKLNIKNAVQIPVKTHAEKFAETAKLSSQFPVSSGNQHKQKELEWIPVVPDKNKSDSKTIEVKTVSSITPVAPTKSKTIAISVVESAITTATSTPGTNTVSFIPLPTTSPLPPIHTPLPPPPLPPIIPLPPSQLISANLITSQQSNVTLACTFNTSVSYPMTLPTMTPMSLCANTLPVSVNGSRQIPSTSTKGSFSNTSPAPSSTKQFDVTSMFAKKFRAQQKLQEDPNDIEALKMIHETEATIQEWVQSCEVPGMFYGSTHVNILTREQLSGPRDSNCRIKRTLRFTIGALLLLYSD